MFRHERCPDQSAEHETARPWRSMALPSMHVADNANPNENDGGDPRHASEPRRDIAEAALPPVRPGARGDRAHRRSDAQRVRQGAQHGRLGDRSEPIRWGPRRGQGLQTGRALALPTSLLTLAAHGRNITGTAIEVRPLMEVETIGVARSLGWRVHMRCAYGQHEGMKSIRECVYRKTLDLDTLVCTRGRTSRWRVWSRGLCVRNVGAVALR
jgi:hypothetical protein